MGDEGEKRSMLFIGGAIGIVVVLIVVIVTVLWPKPPECSAEENTGAAEGSMSVPSGSYAMPEAMPPGQITSGYGPRGGGFHYGTDIASGPGTPIYAFADGVVQQAGPASGFGMWIIIQHEGFATLYGHMFARDVLVSQGQHVKAGQMIAREGYNGQVVPAGPGGSHLHFEVHVGGYHNPTDPAPWLAQAVAGQIDQTAKDLQAVADAVDNSGGDAAAVAENADGGGAAAPSEAAVGEDPCPEAPGAASGQELADGTVPEEFERWLAIGANECPEVDAPLLAAQIQQESGFHAGLVSTAGARGYTQFMPGTWATYGQKVDESGKPVGGPGSGDPNNVGDAVMAQARYMCAIADFLRPKVARGEVKGDMTSLMLAGYNAGEGAVVAAGGIPGYSETTGYVSTITANRQKYAKAGSRAGGEKS